MALMALDADGPPPLQRPGVDLAPTILHREGVPTARTAPPIPGRPTGHLPQTLDECPATLDNVHGCCYLPGLIQTQDVAASVPVLPSSPLANSSTHFVR